MAIEGEKTLSLSSNDVVEEVFPRVFKFPFFGVNYDRMYVGSNGYINFGQVDIISSPTHNNHFASPRISALLTNLDPSKGGNSRAVKVNYDKWNTKVVSTNRNIG